LTPAELDHYKITGTTALTITIPAGITGEAVDREFRVYNKATAAGVVVVHVAEGFGTAGTSYDDVDIAASEFHIFEHDGTHVYHCGVAASNS
jgi:hypothetical protein